MSRGQPARWRASSHDPLIRTLAIVAVLGCVGAWLGYRASGERGSARTGSSAAAPGVASAAHHHPWVWDDEFSGPAGARPNPAKWRLGTGNRSDQLQYYTRLRANASLDGAGHLAITAQRTRLAGSRRAGRGFTSALLETKGVFQKRYGRIEARIKLPHGRGLWPTFWAVGSDIDRVGWPRSGEIDVMENLGNDTFSFSGSVHGPQRGSASGYAVTNTTRSSVSLARGFHVYGVSWRRRRIVFTLDGAPYARVTPASLRSGERWVFDKPFFLILNLAVGGSQPGPPGLGTHFPARMLVDWVRVYR